MLQYNHYQLSEIATDFALNQRSLVKTYELTILIHPDLEMNLEPATSKINSLIGELGGKIIKESNEGKKRLAYTIKDQDFAVYYFYEIELPATAPAKISTNLNISNEVIRYLLVARDEQALKQAARRKKPEEEQPIKEEQ